MRYYIADDESISLTSHRGEVLARWFSSERFVTLEVWQTCSGGHPPYFVKALLIPRGVPTGPLTPRWSEKCLIGEEERTQKYAWVVDTWDAEEAEEKATAGANPFSAVLITT